MLGAALAFGMLVLATPFIAYLFRTPINNGGVLGLLTLFGLSAVLLLLSIGSLMLFLRGHARALTPPRHDDLDASVPSDQRALMLAFAFDAEDLCANRAGGLSARQRANLRAGRHGMFAMGATMLGVTYLGLATMPVLLGAGDGRTSILSSDAAGMWIGAGVITAIIGVSFLYTYRHVRDQVHDRMSIAEGVAGPPGHDGDGHPASRSVRTVPIGGVAVPVLEAAQAEALREGRRYRVCYVRAPLAIVLSIDPL